MTVKFLRHRVAELAGDAPYFAIAFELRGVDPWWQRDFVDIFAVIEGAGRMLMYDPDGTLQSFDVAPGEVYLLRPRDTYQYEGARETGLTGYVVSSTLADWSAFANLVGFASSWLTASMPLKGFFDVDDPGVIDAFEKAVERFRNDASMLDLVEFWVAVTPVFASLGEDRERSRAPGWLIESLDAMKLEANLAAGLPRLLELSRVAPSYLSRTVRRFFGMTPSQVLLDLRMHHAAVLLTTTSESISSIAHRCGFSEASYFTLCFRRAILLTPTEYRRRNASGLGASLRLPDAPHLWNRLENPVINRPSADRIPRRVIRTALDFRDGTPVVWDLVAKRRAPAKDAE